MQAPLKERLERVIKALERSDRTNALEQLLVAWKLTRSPRLADLIDELSLQMDFGQPLVDDLKDEEGHRCWLKVCKLGRPEDLWRLLLSIGHDERNDIKESLERFSSLAWRCDPRLASALADMLRHRAGPVWFQFVNEPSWARLLFAADILARVGDIRTVAVLEQACADHTHPYDWFKELCQHTANRIAASTVTRLTANQILLCEKIADVLAAETDDDRIVDGIAADLDNDSIRVWYADWLRENGDEERAEFISLQLMEARDEATEAQQARAKELLFEHRNRWLGPLAHVETYSVFKRGFVTQSNEPWRRRWFYRRLVGHRVWSTVEQMFGSFVELLADERMKNVKVLRTTPEAASTLTAHESKPWTVLDLCGTADGEDALPLEGTLEKLPRLARLGIKGMRSGVISTAERQCESLLEERPMVLCVTRKDSAFDDADSAAAFFSKARHSRFEEVEILTEPNDGPDLVLTCMRDDNRELSIVRGSAAALLAAELAAFPQRSLKQVVVVGGSFDDKELDTLTAIVTSIEGCELISDG